LNIIDKFLNKLPEILNENDCWNWEGPKDKNGYGVFNHNKKTLKAHRISYEIYYSEPLNELHCLHKCDNPSCVNPLHLFSGTNLDNVRDRVRKGRSSTGNQKGSKNGFSKLTEKEVIEIRNLYNMGVSKKELSKKYNVHRCNIHYIVTNKTWTHLLRGN